MAIQSIRWNILVVSMYHWKFGGFWESNLLLVLAALRSLILMSGGHGNSSAGNRTVDALISTRGKWSRWKATSFPLELWRSGLAWKVLFTLGEGLLPQLLLPENTFTDLYRSKSLSWSQGQSSWQPISMSMLGNYRICGSVKRFQ